jgi:hypothetical protein
MTRKSNYLSISTLIGFVLTMCALSHPAMGQAAPTQPQSPANRTFQVRPVPLEHLYWHFLTLQNFMDAKAAEKEAQGKDGNPLRKNLQNTLGWSDEEYASVRTSSVRLTAKLKDLNAQAVAIRTKTTGISASDHDQLKALTVQREDAINSEVSFFRQNLPPDKIKAFEAYITQLFSPTNAVPRPSQTTGKLPAPMPAPAQPTSAAVQK